MEWWDIGRLYVMERWDLGRLKSWKGGTEVGWSHGKGWTEEKSWKGGGTEAG